MEVTTPPLLCNLRAAIQSRTLADARRLVFQAALWFWNTKTNDGGPIDTVRIRSCVRIRTPAGLYLTTWAHLQDRLSGRLPPRSATSRASANWHW